MAMAMDGDEGVWTALLVVRNGLKGDVISRKSTTDTFLLLNMERGDHTHSYYDRGLMAHSKIDMISIIGRYCM